MEWSVSSYSIVGDMLRVNTLIEIVNFVFYRRDNLILQTEKLKSRNFLVSYVLLNVEKQFLYTSHFSTVSFPEISVYQFGITTLR
jgi:hypothetical protein